MSCKLCCDWYRCSGANCLTATKIHKKNNEALKIVDVNKNGIRRERVVHIKVFKKKGRY